MVESDSNAAIIKLRHKICSLLGKLKESKMRRNEFENKSALMQEHISLHTSEALKLESWHSSRMMVWKAITNGETRLAMAPKG